MFNFAFPHFLTSPALSLTYSERWLYEATAVQPLQQGRSYLVWFYVTQNKSVKISHSFSKTQASTFSMDRSRCQDTSDPGNFGPKTFRHCRSVSVSTSAELAEVSVRHAEVSVTIRHFGSGTSAELSGHNDTSCLTYTSALRETLPQWNTRQHWTKPWQGGWLCLHNCNGIKPQLPHFDPRMVAPAYPSFSRQPDRRQRPAMLINLPANLCNRFGQLAPAGWP